VGETGRADGPMAGTRKFPKPVVIAGLLFCGMLLGLGIAWVLAGPLIPNRTIQNGPWETSERVGDAQAGAYTRATVAIYGTWALPPSEVIYFTATRDDTGAAINPACRYEVRGGDLPADWWSISVYRNFFWVDNPGDRYSRSSSSIQRGPDGQWVIALDADGNGQNGLPLGNADGYFQLSLRLYQPEDHVLANRATIKLPAITKLGCR